MVKRQEILDTMKYPEFEQEVEIQMKCSLDTIVSLDSNRKSSKVVTETITSSCVFHISCQNKIKTK